MIDLKRFLVVCFPCLESVANGHLSATDVTDDEGDADDVYNERSRSCSEGTDLERSERTEEEFFENNGSTSSTASYSDNDSVKSNFDEEDPFKWEKVCRLVCCKGGSRLQSLCPRGRSLFVFTLQFKYL